MIRPRNAHIAAALLLASLAAAPIVHAGSTGSTLFGNNTQVLQPIHPVVPIGVRIYIDPWNPQQPAENAFQTYYDQPEIISRIITDAWERTRGATAAGLVAKMKEHDIGAGFRTYNAKVALPSISTFSIGSWGTDGALVKFTVPNLSLTTSFRTPGPLASGADPRFQITADVTISVSFAFNANKNFSTGTVTAVVSNVQGPLGLDPSAKALQIIVDCFNALGKFLLDIDFKQSLVDILNFEDPAQKALKPLIDANLKSFNDQLQALPAGLSWTAHKLWTDRNRLTLYVATPAFIVPQGTAPGWMKGQISWDPNQVTGTCSQVGFGASVQSGPPPLLRSDGVTFGAAPTSRLRTLLSFASEGLALCAYKLSGLIPDVANALFATTKLAAGKSQGSSSPYVGQLHSTTTIAAQGWAGDYVKPNASDMNWVVTAGLTANGAVGKQVQKQTTGMPDPGAAQTPGVSNLFGQLGASTFQTGAQPVVQANNSGTMSTNSYNAGSNLGSATQDFSLPAGAYMFEYVNDHGETKKFHAKVGDSSMGVVSIAWGKKDVSGPLAHNRFRSTQTRADGRPVLEGLLTANGAMKGRYLAEANGKLYMADFVLAKE